MERVLDPGRGEGARPFGAGQSDRPARDQEGGGSQDMPPPDVLAISGLVTAPPLKFRNQEIGDVREGFRPHSEGEIEAVDIGRLDPSSIWSAAADGEPTKTGPIPPMQTCSAACRTVHVRFGSARVMFSSAVRLLCPCSAQGKAIFRQVPRANLEQSLEEKKGEHMPKSACVPLKRKTLVTPARRSLHEARNQGDCASGSSWRDLGCDWRCECIPVAPATSRRIPKAFCVFCMNLLLEMLGRYPKVSTCSAKVPSRQTGQLSGCLPVTLQLFARQREVDGYFMVKRAIRLRSLCHRRRAICCGSFEPVARRVPKAETATMRLSAASRTISPAWPGWDRQEPSHRLQPRRTGKRFRSDRRCRNGGWRLCRGSPGTDSRGDRCDCHRSDRSLHQLPPREFEISSKFHVVLHSSRGPLLEIRAAKRSATKIGFRIVNSSSFLFVRRAHICS